MTVSCRRSPSSLDASAESCAMKLPLVSSGASTGLSRIPQWSQNLASTNNCAPQPGHTCSSFAPHSEQNCASGRFCWLQREQCTNSVTCTPTYQEDRDDTRPLVSDEGRRVRMAKNQHVNPLIVRLPARYVQVHRWQQANRCILAG